MHKGKVAIVTGASQGIGAATAKELAAQGASVMLIARNIKNCQKLVSEIQDSGGVASAIKCNIADLSQVQYAVSETVKIFGGINILINNAGVIEPIAFIKDSNPRSWADSISINLIGSYFMLQSVLPTFKDNSVVINVSSGAAHSPQDGWSAYCAGKAGLAMLTQSFAKEISSDLIRIYGYAPGTVDTDMQTKIRTSGVNPISKIKKEDHWGVKTPAKVMSWLCSEAAYDLAGQELSINDKALRIRAGLSK
tara:strand:- start:514 stop:1266 length:753 start_codon:yes stop_codon:yes gene_type:complete